MSNQMATAQLGTEKISSLLLRYAIPSIIAMTAASLYNIADSVFIGHGVGPLAITALGLTLPLMNIATAFGAMVGIGASSLLSIKLGQKDNTSAMSILGNVVLLNAITGLTFGLLCFIFLDPILIALGASGDTIGYAREYMQILLIGNVVSHCYFGLNHTLRASGFPKKSMTFMLVSIISNCVLDAVFILWFGWGIAGAAWATVLGQVIALCLQIRHFSNKKHEIYFAKGIFKLKANIVKGILSIGMAPFMMNITASLVVFLINNALRFHGGDIAIGGFSIVSRVSMLFLMIVFGLNQGMQPIVGYNYGAMKFDRVKEALKLVTIAATCVTSFGFVISLAFPGLVAKAFTTDPTLLAVSQEGLMIVMFSFPLVGFQVVASSFFQSIGKAGKAIFLSLTRQLLFLVPLLLILPSHFGTKGVWYSLPISDSVSFIVAVIMMSMLFKQFRKEKLSGKLSA